MGFFNVALVVIVGGMVLSAWKTWVNRPAGGGTDRSQLEALERRVEAIEAGQDLEPFRERLEVLEAIAVNEDTDLKSRFEELEREVGAKR